MSFRQFLLAGLAFLGGLVLIILVVLIIGSWWALKGKPALSSSEKIGVVEIRGLISEADATLKQLHELAENKSVKAIVIRIESPGGAVGASQEIYRELKRVAQEKPVVASLGSVAASGGYYVALGAQKIIASPGTVTGSIGVMIQIPNIQKLLDKLGIKAEVLKSGPYKDTGSLFRPLKEEEKKVLMGTITDIYHQFVTAVAEARGLSEEKVRQIADGRIFTGRQAKEWGLVDELGNFEDAIRTAAQMAGLKGRPPLLYPEKEKTWLKWIAAENLSPERWLFLLAPLYLADLSS